MPDAQKLDADNRTPQWRTPDPESRVKCGNCGHETAVKVLNADMTCPRCNHQEWVLAQPGSGERTDVPQRPAGR